MIIKIKQWGSNKILFEYNWENDFNSSVAKTLEEGVRQGIDFDGAELSHQDLSDCNFDKGKFKNAFFEFSPLKGSSLRNTDFESAYLCQASFVNCDLTGANLRDAKMTGCFFDGAILDVKTPPINDAYFVSEILWRKEKNEDLNNLAARIRMEWDKGWDCWKNIAYELIEFRTMKEILCSKWKDFETVFEKDK